MLRDLSLSGLVLLALAGCAGTSERVPAAPTPSPAPPAATPEPATMGEYLRAIEAAYRKGDYDRGLALVKRVLELEQSNVSTYDRLGSVYYVLGRSGEALTFWRRALPLERDPARRRRLEASIGLASRSLGLPDAPPAAKPAAKPSKRARPAAKTRVNPEESARQYKDGVRFYAEGSYLQATAAFLRALELDPSNEEARKALERLRLQPGTAAP